MASGKKGKWYCYLQVALSTLQTWENQLEENLLLIKECNKVVRYDHYKNQ